MVSVSSSLPCRVSPGDGHRRGIAGASRAAG
nr:MAG TPA: hypothetical protein [Caudoviricetes sp.]